MAKKAKILLIDDDIDFTDATKTILEASSYEVIIAHEGNEGLEKAKEENPDLILLDVIMPIKDGFSAAELLKKDPALRKIPVLMLTGFSEKGPGSGIPVGCGYSLEVEDYIEKPATPQQLLAKVKEYLKR